MAGMGVSTLRDGGWLSLAVGKAEGSIEEGSGRGSISPSESPSDIVLSRRGLVLGCCGAVSGLSGCQSLAAQEQPRLDLRLTNYTDRDQPLKLTLLREDDPGSEDPVALARSFTVPAAETEDESAGTLSEADLVPRRRYLVRVQLKYGGFDQSHAHFYPSESSDDVIDIRIRRDDETGELFVDYRFLA